MKIWGENQHRVKSHSATRDERRNSCPRRTCRGGCGPLGSTGGGTLPPLHPTPLLTESTFTNSPSSTTESLTTHYAVPLEMNLCPDSDGYRK